MPSIVERLDRLEDGQQVTNRHLARIDHKLVRIDESLARIDENLARIGGTFHTVSNVFELMNERLDRLEVGHQNTLDVQKSLVDAHRSFGEGQTRVVDRLDRLIEVTTRERTASLERLARVEERLDVVERKLEHR